MFKTRYFAVVTLAVAMSTVAFAGTGTPGNSRGVSWEEFKERCENPDKFTGDIQREPRDIKIQCTDIQREFVQDAPGSVELAAGRKVIAHVMADKFHVNAIDRDYPFATKPGSCLRYKEIEKTITIERPVTCQDVLAIGKQDPNEYCAISLDTAKGTNPKLIDVRDTGVVRDSCAGGGKGGK